jgi:hypothetical protein
MKFINEVNDETIRKAIVVLLKDFSDFDFLNSLVDVRFNHTNDSGRGVARNTIDWEDTEPTIYIKPYKTVYPWSKVIGHAERIGDTAIYIIYVNTRKLDLPLKDRVMNFRHEIFHFQGYKHDGNKANAYNLKTVPYLGSALFVKFLESVGKL